MDHRLPPAGLLKPASAPSCRSVGRSIWSTARLVVPVIAVFCAPAAESLGQSAEVFQGQPTALAMSRQMGVLKSVLEPAVQPKGTVTSARKQTESTEKQSLPVWKSVLEPSAESGELAIAGKLKANQLTDEKLPERGKPEATEANTQARYRYQPIRLPNGQVVMQAIPIPKTELVRPAAFEESDPAGKTSGQGQAVPAQNQSPSTTGRTAKPTANQPSSRSGVLRRVFGRR